MQIQEVSFSRGEINPLLFGRIDESLYRAGVKKGRNVFVRVEGGLSNRPGTQYIYSTKFAAKKALLVPFVVSTQQPYLVEFGEGYCRFYASGSPVVSGGLPVEVTTPYLESDLPLLRYAQSADTLTVVHPSYVPYELQRQSATSFTFSAPTFKNGPFLDKNTDQSNLVYASALTGTVTLTATKPIWNANHVGSLFYLEQQDLSAVQQWEPGKIISKAAGVAAVLGQIRRSDGKTYKATGVPPPGVGGTTTTISTGTKTPIHDTGTEADGDGNNIPSFSDCQGVNWTYLDSGYGIFKITAFTDSQHVTATVITRPPSNVVGGATVTHGPWTFTGDGTTTAFSPLTGNDTTDPTKYVVTVAGVVQSSDQYTVTAGGGSITFVTAPAAAAAIVVYQTSANNRSYYWALAAWSQDQGYPGAVTYFQDRLTFGGVPQNPQAFWLSKSSTYHDFGVSTPSVDSDALSFKLNSRQINAIRDLIPLNDLIASTSSVVWRVYPGQQGGALTPANIDAKPQNFYGVATAQSVLYADSAIYVTNGGRKIRDLIYQFQFDKFQGDELTLMSRHLIPYGTSIVRMAYAPEPFGQLFVVLDNGLLLTLTYLREQQVVGWTWHDTDGTFEDVCVVPENSSYAIYVIVKRTVQGATARYLERFASREYADNSGFFFVDAGLTYDGRNTTSVLMTLSGGTTWTPNDSATILASGLFQTTGFQASDVGNKNQVWLYGSDGTQIRLKITQYVSPLQVTVQILDAVPAAMQNASTVTWTFAKTNFDGLTHLLNKTVSISADGAAETQQVVDLTGSFTLQNPGGVVTAGLQYLSDVSTLPLPADGNVVIRDKGKALNQVSLVIDGTVGIKIGPSFDDLKPCVERDFEQYVDPTTPESGVLLSQYMTTVFDEDSGVCIRQDQPLPFTLLMIIPNFTLGTAG